MDISSPNLVTHFIWDQKVNVEVTGSNKMCTPPPRLKHLPESAAVNVILQSCDIYIYLRSEGQMSRSSWVCTLLSASPLARIASDWSYLRRNLVRRLLRCCDVVNDIMKHEALQKGVEGGREHHVQEWQKFPYLRQRSRHQKHSLCSH